MAKDLKGKELPKGITQRPDGRYMGRFQYEGEKHCLYDADLDKLLERMEDMRYELRHGIYQKEQNITVSSWNKTWMEEYKIPSVKKGTVSFSITYFGEEDSRASISSLIFSAFAL